MMRWQTDKNCETNRFVVQLNSSTSTSSSSYYDERALWFNAWFFWCTVWGVEKCWLFFFCICSWLFISTIYDGIKTHLLTIDFRYIHEIDWRKLPRFIWLHIFCSYNWVRVFWKKRSTKYLILNICVKGIQFRDKILKPFSGEVLKEKPQFFNLNFFG